MREREKKKEEIPVKIGVKINTDGEQEKKEIPMKRDQRQGDTKLFTACL